ncbi:hypothetical protein FVO59_12750 [Microbacterium esteraromaticum]|uniref:Uncharacterized protein n=1 Tax=Microbacterium esteraromaticum TaxID=57043 RepID=A0A7D7WGH3_9MICO|nr:hypothetical protein [Microbacterium esteraromaticum]QMU97972.1 hypothetical protein FVO59_12750 [Microbacterium esteraromaticum]
MAIPDITTLADEELVALAQSINTLLAVRAAEEADDAAARRAAIAAEITETVALIDKLTGYRDLTDADLAAIPVPVIIRELLTAHIDTLAQQVDMAHVITAAEY